LDSSETFFKPEHFVPLGHGRRVCMGEPLAKAELFIFFVTLLQKIKFDVVEGKDKEPDPKKYMVGVTKVPEDFNVKVSPRLNK
jgi:cytochrome P450